MVSSKLKYAYKAMLKSGFYPEDYKEPLKDFWQDNGMKFRKITLVV